MVLQPHAAAALSPGSLSASRHKVDVDSAGTQSITEAHPMPFEWKLFLKILAIVLRILQNLPAEVDNRPVVRSMADGIDELNGSPSSLPP